jgi:hypothetical protein
MNLPEIVVLPIAAAWAFIHWLLPTTTAGWLFLMLLLNMRDSRKAREAAERTEAAQKALASIPERRSGQQLVKPGSVGVAGHRTGDACRPHICAALIKSKYPPTTGQSEAGRAGS